MKHLVVRRSMQGWFMPLFPYFILYVFAPHANANNWLPRQMPKMGLGGSRARAQRREAMVSTQSCGSPGPLLTKMPSYSMAAEFAARS